MVNEVQYTSIKRVLDSLLDHPMLRDLTLEQAIRHALRFIALHGYNKFYQDKIDNVEIHEFRGVLPCDLIRIIQVKDTATQICLRAMTDHFAEGMRLENRTVVPPKPHKDLMNNVREEIKDMYIPPMPRHFEEPSFKTQGRIIYTSFPEGIVEIAYKAIPVDEDGFPLLIDNETYLGALEAYIKKQVFTVKFDQGKIASNILQNAKQDYAILAAELQSEFTLPNVNELEAISRFMTTAIKGVRHFDNGFTNLGDREWVKRH